MNRRVAVMVDGDNMSAAHAQQILHRAGELGRIDIARTYTDATRPSDWLTMPGFCTIHAGTGKNATDLLMAIDAVELALSQEIASFVIATSDGDFSHLAHRLRARGRHVLGVGEQKAPPRFRAACSAFLIVPSSRDSASPRAVAPPSGRCSKLDLDIRAMIAKHGQKGRGMRLVDLAPRMHAAHGTRISAQPGGSWRAYLATRPDLYDLDPRGPEAMVRLCPTGFTLVA